MSYIKMVVRAIFEAPDDAFCISSMQALQIGRDSELKFTHAKSETLCADLVRHGWLRECAYVSRQQCCESLSIESI